MFLSVVSRTVLVLSNIFLLATAFGSTREREVKKFFESFNSESHNKCGFHIIANYYMTPGDRFGIKGILQIRPPNDTSVSSPSGKFRIHFDTSNVNGNQPLLYDSTGQKIPNSTYAFVDSVEKICDYVYHVEVDSLGYPPPPSDSGAGGGNEYDIYIQSLSSGQYGYTDFDQSKPLINRVNPTYNAWTVIRNEYGPGDSIYTQGMAAIEVTIAHEFHHGIQVGNYGLWQNDLWFYELTSTWMEQVVYPQVRDYYQYLENFFNNVDLPFNFYQTYSFAGYERCIFGIFVQNEYGTPVMKSIWQNMAREGVIPSIEDAFRSIGIDPSYAFHTFAQWNYFTGYRSQFVLQYNVSTYPFANDYPLVKVSGFDNLGSGGVYFSDMALRLTEHFYQINVGTDTLGIAVVNNNFSAAENYDTTSYPFSVGISLGGSSCVMELTNGYCIFFDPSDHLNWGIVPAITSNDTSGNLAVKNNVVFPQPFNPSLRQVLRIPYPFADGNSPSLSILKVSGELVGKFDGDNNMAQYLGGKYFIWNGKDRNGKTVSSGVYIYVVTDGSKSVVGKIAVVRN